MRKGELKNNKKISKPNKNYFEANKSSIFSSKTKFFFFTNDLD